MGRLLDCGRCEIASPDETCLELMCSARPELLKKCPPGDTIGTGRGPHARGLYHFWRIGPLVSDGILLSDFFFTKLVAMVAGMAMVAVVADMALVAVVVEMALVAIWWPIWPWLLWLSLWPWLLWWPIWPWLLWWPRWPWLLW